jgi:hypothetical protein
MTKERGEWDCVSLNFLKNVGMTSSAHLTLSNVLPYLSIKPTETSIVCRHLKNHNMLLTVALVRNFDTDVWL